MTVRIQLELSAALCTIDLPHAPFHANLASCPCYSLFVTFRFPFGGSDDRTAGAQQPVSPGARLVEDAGKSCCRTTGGVHIVSADKWRWVLCVNIECNSGYVVLCSNGRSAAKPLLVSQLVKHLQGGHPYHSGHPTLY